MYRPMCVMFYTIGEPVVKMEMSMWRDCSFRFKLHVSGCGAVGLLFLLMALLGPKPTELTFTPEILNYCVIFLTFPLLLACIFLE